MRVAIGGFYHETNTRSRTVTEIDSFHAYQYFEGNEMIDNLTGTNSEIGGMIDALNEHRTQTIPLLFASAVPSGLITKSCFECIYDQFVKLLTEAGEIDAVLLSLHGAAVVEDILDPDTEFARRIRAVVGDAMPIAITLDYHANLSQELFELANYVSVYRTYPHTDMAERGREVTEVILSKSCLQSSAFVKLPLVTVPLVQSTDDYPMTEIMDHLSRLDSKPEIIGISIAMGFAYADSPDLGAAVIVYAKTQELANRSAQVLSDLLWCQRELFSPNVLAMDDLTDSLLQSNLIPVVVVDPADNIGGGSAGDGTAILSILITSGIKGVIVISDPEAAEEANKLELGSKYSGLVGGKTDDLHGVPIKICGIVKWRGVAKFKNIGTYMTGFVTSMGQTAVIHIDGLDIVLTSYRVMPFDVGVLTSVDITPQDQQLIVVKSAIAWRAAFEPIAGDIVVVDTPGICPASIRIEDYQHSNRNLWPFDRSISFKAQ